MDRELYLPRSWTEDRDRCRDAGIGDEVEFATKPQLGIAMLARAHAAGVLQGWVSADEADGQNPGFRNWLAAHEVPFVLATRRDDTLALPGDRRWAARSLATEVPRGSWERRSAGDGAHGPRFYDLATVALDPAGLPGRWGHWGLIRRQITGDGTAPELAFYRCAGPAATPSTELIRVAGARWAIEETFRPAQRVPCRAVRRNHLTHPMSLHLIKALTCGNRKLKSLRANLPSGNPGGESLGTLGESEAV